MTHSISFKSCFCRLLSCWVGLGCARGVFLHGVVMTWKGFLHYWNFITGCKKKKRVVGHWRGHGAPLQWRHNEHGRVSDHQPYDYLLNRLFRPGSRKTSKLRVTCLRLGNLPVTGDFPVERASSAENVSIWWRHHITIIEYPLSNMSIFLDIAMACIAYSLLCNNRVDRPRIFHDI